VALAAARAEQPATGDAPGSVAARGLA
jgi:hypothetical protein